MLTYIKIMFLKLCITDGCNVHGQKKVIRSEVDLEEAFSLAYSSHNIILKTIVPVSISENL